MLVKNAVVTMDWEAEGFFETKKDGFVAAVHIYETDKCVCPVIFKGSVACMIWDSETEAPATRDELKKVFAEIVKDDPEAPIDEYFPDDYVELSNGVEVYEDVADFYQFTDEQKEDILNRVRDIMRYYVVEEERMC